MLAQIGGVAGMGVFTQRARAQSNETNSNDTGANGSTANESAANVRRTIRAVIPTQQGFAGNYTGQILLFNHLEAESTTAEAVENCEFASWSPDSSNRYTGMLVDRLRESPRSADTVIYTNGSREATIDVGSVGIINRTHECSGDVIGLEIEQFDPEAIARLGAGDPTATPEATETTSSDGPGFGVLAGLVGVGGAALARAVRGSDD
jgi:hypothetical protein